MKTKFIFLLLPLLLAGCSQKSNTELSPAAAKMLPPMTMVETPESQEQRQIKGQALALLNTRDYTALEAMASKYRNSKEQYADGYWKLWLVYHGLEPADDAPEDVWQTRQKQIHDWVQARPESATARITLARVLADYAWYARGSDYAGKISEAQWKTFFDRLNQASAVLHEADQLQERCPMYWSTMLMVALGSQEAKASYDKIFEAAVQEYPDYQGFYYARAVFLLPRWYGGAGEWQTDLAKSADRLGGEAGDKLYAQVVWDVGDYGDMGDIFDDNRLSWDRVDRGFTAILKQYPDSLIVLSEWAYLAGHAGDHKRGQDCLQKIKGRVDLSVWKKKELYIAVANWAYGP